MQQVGDELVVALHVEVAYVEEDDSVARPASFAQDLNRAPVPRKQRLEMLGDRGQAHHLGERAVGDFGDESGDERVFGRGLNDKGELRGRLGELDGGLRRGVLGAVNDVSPVD